MFVEGAVGVGTYPKPRDAETASSGAPACTLGMGCEVGMLTCGAPYVADSRFM